MQPTNQNQPLSKLKKQGSKFDIQGSDTKLYRVSSIFVNIVLIFVLF